MSEFDELLSKLLVQRPELQHDIYKMIEEKKKIVGAGYLTDQGALFLIAADLGIKLSEPFKIEMNLKELYIGAREVTLEAKVMNMSPIKQFSRKDGEQLLLRTITIYDEYTTASVKLWNDKSNLKEIKNLKPGDSIKIIKAYIRSDINGEAVVNIGQNAEVTSIPDISRIPTIDSIATDVSDINYVKKNLVVTGSISDTIQLIKFTNSKGQQSTALKLSMKGNNGKIVKVILWGKDDSDLPKNIPIGTKTRLIGVKTKNSRYGNMEIHGNEYTLIEVDDMEQPKPITLKILDIIKNGFDSPIALGVNQEKNIFKIRNNDNNTVIDYKINDVVEFWPSRIYGNTITIDKNSSIKLIPDHIIESRTKIANIKSGKEYCVEAIVLKISDVNTIRTKIGEIIEMASMLIEDDSGNIWVKGWRNQTKLIGMCLIGDIINIINVDAKEGIDGKEELLLNRFSAIIKKN